MRQDRIRQARYWLPVLFVAGCTASPADEQGEPPRAFRVDELAVSRANTSFGLELFAMVHAAAADPNVMVSPLSVSMALGMTANGAEDETLRDMRATLGFGTMPEDSVNAAYEGLIAQLHARDPGVEFRLANSVWHDQRFSVEQPFLELARDYFDAEVRAIDFRTATAPRTISGWAEDATGGRIKDLITRIDPQEVMFLVNAVYFKAPWSRPFDPDATRPGPFQRLSGGSIDVPTMSGDGAWPHTRNSDVDIVELLYADSAFSMVIVVPATGRDLDDVVDSLTPERWQTWMDALEPGRILFSMPKFRFEFGETLNDALIAMGMGVAFDDSRADFDRISRERTDLYISRVEHKTFIDVHELGTEAAAATAVGVGVTSLPPRIVVDRPFLFAIRERSAGTLLFVGRVGDPSAS
jgi:serpin B